MKYKYTFGSGEDEIDTDEKWVEILKDFDRLEQNADRKERRHNIHIDAFSFEPSFLGVEDENIMEMFDGSPAFEYAIKKLIPKHQDVLYRRGFKGEKYIDIGKTYNLSADAVYQIYRSACERFKRYYAEGVWLYSKDNTATESADKVKHIPFGLTIEQIKAIRAYRCECKPLSEIAKLVGVPLNRVKQFLHNNPVLETKCPYCNNAIQQSAYGRMQVFCSSDCYYKWFRLNGGNQENINSTVQRKTHLTKRDKQIIDFYRQYFVPIHLIRKITGISEQRISAHCYSKTLPYTFCKNCGVKVEGEVGKRTLKYCSEKCSTEYGNKLKRAKQKMKGKRLEEIIPMPEQLEYAIWLREVGYTYELIGCLTGLSNNKVTTLFRFYSDDVRACAVCGEEFSTHIITKVYCSKECKEKRKRNGAKKCK